MSTQSVQTNDAKGIVRSFGSQDIFSNGSGMRYGQGKEEGRGRKTGNIQNRSSFGTAGSTAVAEVVLRNRFKDGEGARVLGRVSAGQWLYLARTAASEINMGIASVRFLLFLLIAGA